MAGRSYLVNRDDLLWLGRGELGVLFKSRRIGRKIRAGELTVYARSTNRANEYAVAYNRGGTIFPSWLYVCGAVWQAKAWIHCLTVGVRIVERLEAHGINWWHISDIPQPEYLCYDDYRGKELNALQAFGERFLPLTEKNQRFLNL